MSNIIMLDTEFLDPQPGGVIITIGAVAVNTKIMKITDEFYVKVDADDAIRRGCTVNSSTLRWWMDQPAEARNEAFSGKEDLQVSLAKFTNFFEKVRASNGKQIGSTFTQIWTNGKEDLVLMEAAYRKVNPHLREPWVYNEPRDFRTVRDMFPNISAPADTGVKHHALDDARYQAKYLIKILQAVQQPEDEEL